MPKKGQKKCVECNTYFTPFRSTTERACTLRCAMSYSRKKEIQRRENARKLQKQRDSEKEAKRLNHQLDQTKTIVNLYIRKRDTGKHCITCNSYLVDERYFDAGHYYHLGDNKNYSAIRFDLDNIHGQCKKCNLINRGEHQKYTENLPKRIGQQRFEALQERARQSKASIKKWTKEELKELRIEIKEKIKKL